MVGRFVFRTTVILTKEKSNEEIFLYVRNDKLELMFLF